MGRETETVAGQKREREARELSAARTPQIVGNLWPDLCAMVRRDAGLQSVQ